MSVATAGAQQVRTMLLSAVGANLAWGIAGALAFDPPEDALAVLLQQRIAAEGVEAVLEAVSGIRRDETLGLAVLERYQRLHQEARWG